MIKNAYAKINLALEILQKRQDGYHEVKTVMQKVSLCDTVSVNLHDDNSINLSCDVYVCEEKDNLAYKAAVLFREEYNKATGKSFGADISIIKNIPDKAGLAGGSADCAAVLDCLYQMLPGVTYERIEKIAASLGSDINFCLEKYKCALCKGRGTDIFPCQSYKSGNILICVPDNGLKTSEIYRLFDDAPVLFGYSPSEEILKVLNSGEGDIFPHVLNSFSSICEKEIKDITEIKNVMKSSGALCAQMSGSGSSVFGIFADRCSLENAYNKLSSKYKRLYICNTVE